MEPDISVIIPCLNEKDSIGIVITSVVRELQEGGFTYEIVVVDNGSKDGSDAIANTHKALVLFSPGGTVARVRNVGANIAKGRLLVFLDADVVVHSPWGKTLRNIYKYMDRADDMITGSHPSVPDNIKPLLSSWYKSITNDFRNTHLGTGHMVVSANIFRRIGGFDENLVTGEDYDFCFRAKKIGVSIVSNPDMRVYHLGYPQTITDFIKREIWHGQGDLRNLKTILRSSVALCGIVFLLLHIFLLTSLFVNIKYVVVSLSILIIMALLVNFYKFGIGEIRSFIYRSITSYIYLFSRGLSFPISIYKKISGISNQSYYSNNSKA